jgi:hypothetical protein
MVAPPPDCPRARAARHRSKKAVPQRRAFCPRLRRQSLFSFAPGEAHSGRGPIPHKRKEALMSWTTPTLVEVGIDLEINGYLPAQF